VATKNGVAEEAVVDDPLPSTRRTPSPSSDAPFS
jgi:hypothetical protein